MATVTPARRPPVWAVGAALVSGVLGLVGNVFLVAFLALTHPYYSDPTWGWLGSASDVVAVGQFAALVPVILVVGRLLPPSRLMRACTALTMITTGGIAVVSAALAAGLMTFDSQVWFVVGFLVPLYGWLLVANSVGHRAGALSRSVTRLGLLLGVSWPAAAALVLAGLLIGGVDLGSQAYGLPGAVLLVPGIVLGLLSWLALPLWPLALAATAYRPSRPEARTLPQRVELEAGR
ncbi:MAG TPA: hypothetical protein VEX66_14025 [Microlunatus sp.]|nr:hypothetical protein [Microlunatus sp.]